MKAKELRIGNYVNFKFHKDCGGVKGIEVFVSDLEIILQNNSKSEYYTPTPLTEEWLVKFGFDKGDDSYNFRGFCLENRNTDPFLPELRKEKLKDSFGAWCNNNFLTNIKHVHQLQNLYFALTNEELTIK